jgi:hypothetical protein
MDDALAMPVPAVGLPLEQVLYARSPLGPVLTTVAVFVLMFGLFVTVAHFEHVIAFLPAAYGFTFSNAAWPAFVLSLLCSTALLMQRYVRLAEANDAPGYARILSGGMASALQVTAFASSEVRLVRSTLIGLGVGIAVSVAVRISEFREGHVIPLLTMIWFGFATTFLSVLFARGVEQTRAGNRSYGRLLQAELKIDLLRTDTLAVLGRSAARSALIWFVISAVACLFFVGGDLDWLTIALILACAAMGIGMFVSIMSRIHRQIVTAKRAELEHVRCQIEAARRAFLTDSHAPTRLHGLIAYEKRIADAPEWPFDQSTLVRVAASALIVTVPWFGQAIVQYLIEHVTQR